MTEDQYMSFRNEQTLLTNSCDSASQDTAFDLEKYGPYLDKIRALFVPSLEYRVRSLLDEFVYGTNSRWAKQFPCFKKFIDTIATWKDPLNRVAEYNIGTMEEMMRNTVKLMVKDDLITCFLDSIILHHRLNKVCRELDALGIEDNILRSLSVLNFVNEGDCLLNRDCFTDFNITTDCKMNLNTVMSYDEKGSAGCKKAIKPIATNTYDGSAGHARPTTSEYREHRQILDSNRNILQQEEDNHYPTCGATGSQNDSTDKVNRSFNTRPCNAESRKARNSLRLRIIVHKIYLEDYGHSTFPSSSVARLPLPCKPSNLIRRIFEADPSLTESCLIIIKRKFEDSIYNVCSCLNDVLEKLDIKVIRALRLNCEIYPGYISFKLKASGSDNIKKCLFVARIPICQNVCKRTIQQDSAILSCSSKSSTEVNESKCFGQCEDDGTTFNDTLERIDEETKKFDETRCSRSNLSFTEDMATDISQNEAKNSNEKKITRMITEDVLKHIQDLAIISCNKSCEDIVEEISNTACVDNSEERNEEYCEVSNSTEINCDDEKCRKHILETDNSIMKNDTSTQLVNNANCMCSSCENFIGTDDEVEDIFSNKDLNSFSQTMGTNEYDWTCSSAKEINPENEDCNANTSSVISFVQNSEYDKQLVELNCNRFSNNNIKAIDKHSDMREHNSSLNSAKVEIGCNSCCFCRSDDFIDITVIDNISEENIVCAFETSQSDLDTVKTRGTDYSKTVQISSGNSNLLTISVQTPRSKVSSKGVNVDMSYPRVDWLASDDERNISTVIKASDTRNKIANPSTHALISKKRNQAFSGMDKEIVHVTDGTRDFITSLERSSASKERFRFKGDSTSSGISIEEYLCTENHSSSVTSNVSPYCRSLATTSEFAMSDKRDKFEKSDKSRSTSKLRGCRCASSWNGIRNVASMTIRHRTTPRRNPDDDYSAEIRPQTIFAITKFRNSVDRSVDRIKRLIRAKLGGILFSNKISNNNKMTKTFWRNEEFSGDTRRRKTNGRRIKQGYSVTSCSTCDCCRRSYTISSRESSNVILSIRRNKEKKRSEENMKFRDHRSADGSEVLLSSRSIRNSPWSHYLLTSTTRDKEKRKLSRNNRSRYDRKKKVGNVINFNRNSCRCNFGNSETSITMSSQSAKVSLTENDSEYFEHYACKRRKGICDDERICKQLHNRDQRERVEVRHKCGYWDKNKYQDVPIKYSSDNSVNESLRTSLSHTWRKNTRNVHKQFYGTSGLRNVRKFTSLKKNRQIFEKDMSDYFDNNKSHIFTILTNAYNDYVDDLNLDFKLGLLRYVELCKSVKRSLMRTLRSGDIYEVITASAPVSDL